MKITICGGGQTGQAICESLWKNNEITLIDNDESVVSEIFSQYDIQAIHGSVLSPYILKEADVANTDVFIAVTNSDETNIVASNLAKALGTQYVCARVRGINYYEDLDFVTSSLNIDQLINPEFRSADLISRIVRFPSTNNIEVFAKGKVQIFEWPVSEYSLIANKSLIDFSNDFSSDILVCLIERNGEIIIPSGDTIIKPGDNIHVTGLPQDIKKLMVELQIKNRPLKKLFIIGGGTMTYFLLNKLKNHPYNIKVIEKNRLRASQIAQAFPYVEVIQGDGTNQNLLLDEGLRHYDASIALTNRDEANILISLFAHSEGVEKIFTLVNRPYLLKPLTHMGLDTVITPKKMAAEKIIRLVRNLKATRQSTVTNFYQLVPNEVEALEFEILNEAKITAQPLSGLEIIDQTLIINIQRQDRRILPSGDTQIQVGDLVSIVTKHSELSDINEIIK